MSVFLHLLASTAQTEPTTTNVFILFGNDTADIASSNTATTTTTSNHFIFYLPELLLN